MGPQGLAGVGFSVSTPAIIKWLFFINMKLYDKEKGIKKQLIEGFWAIVIAFVVGVILVALKAT